MIIPMITMAITSTPAIQVERRGQQWAASPPALVMMSAKPQEDIISQSVSGFDIREEMSPIQKVADERLTLMARRHAGYKETPELLARLELLNERLEAMAPQVTAEDVQRLEGYAAELQSLREELAEIEEEITVG